MGASADKGPASVPLLVAQQRSAAWALLSSESKQKDKEQLKPVFDVLQQLQQYPVGGAASECLPPPTPDWVAQLGSTEAKVFSQNGEDGVLLAILLAIGVGNPYYVEFGTQDASECNTRVLREALGWKGLLMDGSNENPDINLHKEFISPVIINDLFQKYAVPHNLDFLSIDIDFDDWWVWRAVDPLYRPRIFMIEHNAGIPPNMSVTVNPLDSRRWAGDNYFGASLRAMTELGNRRGYTLVYVDIKGVNAMFVRSDILACQRVQAPPLEQLYRRPNYFGTGTGHAISTDATRVWWYLDEQGKTVRKGPIEWSW